MPTNQEGWEEAWARQAQERRDRQARADAEYDRERAEHAARVEREAAARQTAAVREELDYRESEASNLRGDVRDLQELLGRERERLRLVRNAVHAFLREVNAHNDLRKSADFNGEFYRAWNELATLMINIGG